MTCRKPLCRGLVIHERIPSEEGWVDYVHCVICGEFYPESEDLYQRKVMSRIVRKVRERRSPCTVLI